MSDPTNQPHDNDATVSIDPDLTDETDETTSTESTHTETSHKEESTNRVVNDGDEGTYTDVDLPDDEPKPGVGTA
jgi:hypothetical protein